MNKDNNEQEMERSTHSCHSYAHELCKKARETLDKANKLLNKSEEQPDSITDRDGDQSS